jgi:hypothetical protein
LVAITQNLVATVKNSRHRKNLVTAVDSLVAKVQNLVGNVKILVATVKA